MAGSMKDALQKSGLAPAEPPKVHRTTPTKTWLNELPEDEAAAHVPFEAPALTKAKPSSGRPPAPRPEPSEH